MWYRRVYMVSRLLFCLQINKVKTRGHVTMAPPLFYSLFCLLQDEIIILFIRIICHVTVFVDEEDHIDVGFLSSIGTFGLYGCSAQVDIRKGERLSRYVLTLISDQGPEFNLFQN